MKKLYKISFLLAALFASSAIFAQGTLKGTVIDITSNEGLPGANIIVKGTNTGAITDMNGDFSFQVPASGTIEIKFVGYNPVTRDFTVAAGETTKLGKLGMASNNTLLGDVKIVGVADVAKDRKTPVAVSTIMASEIQEKLGSQEFPEILNNTPSVYATKQGGGFGDARINIRGFSQENIAVMINGVPVNDMENGRVFWSNWAGLSDVTTAMQVQRGLGSSKLAISSVGGTINILTKTTDAKKGGSFGIGYGNSGYNKITGSYSTGKMENGLAVSALLSRTAGDGYVNGTEFEGMNYFLGVGYENDKHSLQFTVTGAPQVHNQRSGSFFSAATLAEYLENGDRYNREDGVLDGEEFNIRRNFYHKPVSSINWDWLLSDRSKISTVVYASYGRGGGTGDIGRLDGNFLSSNSFRDENGVVQFDDIVSSNSGTETLFGSNTDDNFSFGNQLDPFTQTFLVNDDEIDGTDSTSFAYLEGAHRRNGIVRRASVNSHNWVGAISNFNHRLSENFTLDVGLDVRSYRGIHYRRVDDFLGADGYRDNDDVNNPFNVITESYESTLGSLWNVFRSIDDEQKINYHNDGLVKWLGAFGQLEYSKDALTAFVQGGVSNQSYKRIDYFAYASDDPARETDWKAIGGGNLKGGLNYNIDEKQNVFFNTGVYSKQPFIDAVYSNNQNEITSDDLLKNESIFGLELGYGLRTSKVIANVNLYRTSWKNRFLLVFDQFADPDPNAAPDAELLQGRGSVFNAEEIHQGIEIEGRYRASDKITVRAMASIGNWEYGGNASADMFWSDDPELFLGVSEFDLDGVKVGDAAQTTARIGLDYKPLDELKLDVSWRLAENLYSGGRDLGQSIELPGFSLLDAGISYKFETGDDDSQALNFRLNVNNVLNTRYIAESTTGDPVVTDDPDPEENTPSDEIFDGVNTSNRVFFGFGMTWNLSVRYNF